MATTNQANGSNSNSQSETEIQENLNTLIDLISELNQVEENLTSSNQKDKINKKQHYKPDKDITLEIKQEKKSASTSTDNNFRNKEENKNPILGKEKNLDSLPQQYTTNDNSVIEEGVTAVAEGRSDYEMGIQTPSLSKQCTDDGVLEPNAPKAKSLALPINQPPKITPSADNINLVYISENKYTKSQKSIATLQQSVKNLENKLKDNQHQLDEIIDSVNSLISLTVELINLQSNTSPTSIVSIIAPLIDRIIETRSTEDLQIMGKALSTVLPVAITQQIAATPQSIAKALAPEIALSIQEQILLDKESISRSIGPEMGKAIKAQIELERDAMVDALYPVIGSTIAKYMGEVINTINEKVENALSVEGVKRKIRAKIQGVSEAELILQEALPYQVQAIFLIHKASGLVIRELQPDLDHQLESDLVAGMLTAIRSFANDLISDSSELDEIDYSEYKILLEVAGYCYLAVVVKGEPSKQFRQKTRDVLSKLVLKHGNIIEVYDGDSSTVPESIALLLEELLEQDRQQKSSGSPSTLIWLIVILLSVIFVPWGIFKYKNYVADRVLQQAAIELDAAPELSVYRLTSHIEQGKLILSGRVPSEYLRNIAAERIAKIAQEAKLTLENQIVAINVPTDPTITQEEVERVTSILNQQEGVAILSDYKDYAVTVTGFTLNQTRDALIAQTFKQIPGVEQVIINLDKQLPIVDNRIYFASGSLELNSADFTNSVNQIGQLLAMYPQLHLRIIGHSDRSGIPQDNQKLAQDRANKVATALIAQEINSKRLHIMGSIEPPPGVTANQPLQKSRCVRFEFFIPDRGKNAHNS